MEVDDSPDHQLHLCPRDFVKQMSLVMDDHGSQPHQRRSGMRVSTKSKAPSPPGLNKLNSPGFSQWYPGSPELKMEDQKENLIDKELSLVVVLPGGVEKMTTVHGSKPLMDLLVTLCAKYHLNPSSHTLELITTNRSNVKLKPNALIGTSDAQKIIIKPKGEDKNKKTGPHMPEATVRMVINYKQTQKTILRVNPRVPLAELLPAICEKCEFETESTVLLRDAQSLAPLDLSSSLNDYAIREVYARDTKRQPASPVFPASPTHSGSVTPGKDKIQKEKENKGLFSMFRKSKKKPEQAMTASAPASPVLVSKPRPLSMALPSSHSSPLSSSTTPTDVPKKRRAPQPPILVSQSCPNDLSPRQRLSSEPNVQLDSDQMAGLSRGSSAESSLKRTKRKAPPPPTSQTVVVVPETIPQDEYSQGSAPANTLEEIMEQEEANASVKSATASDTQGEDISLSPDVSLHSPSPDTEIVSTMSFEGNGEDQSCDLSSDGNELQNTVNYSANAEVETTVGTDSPEIADTNSDLSPVENVDHQSICEESTDESVEVNSSTLPSTPHLSLSQPVMQETEAQTSIQVNTETLGEQPDMLDHPVATSTSHTTGEDAQVQTDFPPLPVSAQEHMDSVPPSSNAIAYESGLKKDMATETEDLGSSDFKHVLSHTSETSSCQDAILCAAPPTKTSSLYATDAEPKPKPSNELTRDYIPKVGMTTYTIVPQKSLEKLRYFEVALTLETPPAAPQEGLNISSLQLEENASSMGQTHVSKETSELHSLSCSKPREALVMSNSTTTNQHTVNGSIPESIHSSTSLSQADNEILSTDTQASQASSPAEVKEIKIPPATKPKPGSFRLPQQKKTPGYYVTSAAEKSLSASPSYSQKEAQGNAERAKLPPPPLPPPVQCPEETTGAANVRLSPKVNEKDVTSTRLTRQCSLPSREPTLGLSLEKLRSFAAPRPFSPTTPSRFAQAVSSAVKRSQSLSHAPQSPKSPPFSPVTRSPVVESKGLPEFKDSETTELHHDKNSTIQEEESEPPSFSGNVQVEGESTV